MAKTRMLKPDLRTSEKVASWPIEVRYLWVLLWGYVDDHGKAKDNPLLVKADCFPLDPEITGEVVNKWLWKLAADEVLVRYTVSATDLLAVKNWREHQKPQHPTADVLPGWDHPDAVIRSLHAPCMTDACSTPASLTPELSRDGFGIEVESGFEVEKSAHLTAGDSDVFESVWKHWPKKDDRKDALAKWPRAVKESGLSEQNLADIAIAHGDAYRAHKAKRFTPALVVWLNKARWGNELPAADEPQQKMTAAQANLSTVQYFQQQEDQMEITA